VTNVRTEIVRLAQAIVADEAAHHDWTYAAVRPMPVPASWKPGQAVRGDCSKGVQYLCRWGGGPDPMGSGFGDYGNSTTLCAHLAHLASPSDLELADVVTFGNDGDEHAALVVETGADPLLWSFGHQGAPNVYQLSQDHRVAQCLRLPVGPVVVAPADRLRAETGYWAWLQWRLGEGDWAHYHAAAPDVRPHVPAVIPPGWWRRYTKFVLARKRPNRAAGPTVG
jgi:hypothetical protein